MIRLGQIILSDCHLTESRAYSVNADTIHTCTVQILAALDKSNREKQLNKHNK